MLKDHPFSAKLSRNLSKISRPSAWVSTCGHVTPAPFPRPPLHPPTCGLAPCSLEFCALTLQIVLEKEALAFQLCSPLSMFWLP